MRDHREGHDPRTLVDITEQMRAVTRKNSALRVTPPDWRIGRAPKPTEKKRAKVRRRQADTSRKRNR